MAACLADVLRANGTVQAVARFVEADPCRADGSARAGRDAEFAGDVRDFGPVFGIKRVVGIGGDCLNAEGTERAFFQLLCD